MNRKAGHCLCGAVSYSFDGMPNWQAHCHCESCRRNCSAPYTSFFGVTNGRWRWTGTTPLAYQSSPGVRRYFCGICGTPMAFAGRRWPDETHFYAASLEDPSAFTPTAHFNWNEHLPWVATNDGLPCMGAPRLVESGQHMEGLLALIRVSFAEHQGRISPPSSTESLTEEDLRDFALRGEIWVIEESSAPVGCIFLTGQSDHLYLGRLAIHPDFRLQGLARQLIDLALNRARAQGVPELRLQTRVELVQNHAAFRRLGFFESHRTAHSGFDRPTSVTFVRPVDPTP